MQLVKLRKTVQQRVDVVQNWSVQMYLTATSSGRCGEAGPEKAVVAMRVAARRCRDRPCGSQRRISWKKCSNSTTSQGDVGTNVRVRADRWQCQTPSGRDQSNPKGPSSTHANISHSFVQNLPDFNLIKGERQLNDAHVTLNGSSWTASRTWRRG